MAKMTFEEAMEQLENLVRELESGSLTLEVSLKKFEEGMKLSQFCSAKLSETEQKISILLERSDGVVEPAAFSVNQEDEIRRKKSDD